MVIKFYVNTNIFLINVNGGFRITLYSGPHYDVSYLHSTASAIMHTHAHTQKYILMLPVPTEDIYPL